MRAQRLAISEAKALLLAGLLSFPHFVLAAEPPPERPAGLPATLPVVTVIDPTQARGILGRAVQDSTGKDMGHIVDIIVDPGGHVVAAVIDFGGFLGVGSRKIAVEWDALHFGQAVQHGNEVSLRLTREQLTAAPEYTEGKPLIAIGATGDLRPLSVPPPVTPEK
jgi:PRC-barrel domain protein